MKPGERIVCEACGVNISYGQPMQRTASGFRHDPDLGDCITRHEIPVGRREWRLPVRAPSLPTDALAHVYESSEAWEPYSSPAFDYCEVRVDPQEPTRHVCEKGHNVVLVPR